MQRLAREADIHADSMMSRGLWGRPRAPLPPWALVSALPFVRAAETIPVLLGRYVAHWGLCGLFGAVWPVWGKPPAPGFSVHLRPFGVDSLEWSQV